MTDALSVSPVIPVITLHRAEDALPLAHALREGGIGIMEVTLRTPAALAVIETLARGVEGMAIGAGTVLSPAAMQQAKDAGAQFVISPGLTQHLADAAAKMKMPYVPGVATASEVMRAQELGFSALKFFPAELAGGVPMLKQFGALFTSVRFCPTGGIGPKNFREYLALKNVACVGGSWLVPEALIAAKNWAEITRFARECALVPPPESAYA